MSKLTEQQILDGNTDDRQCYFEPKDNSAKGEYINNSVMFIRSISDIQALVDKDKRIADLIEHYKQVIYNVSKISFIEGAGCKDTDFQEQAIEFAKMMLEETDL